MEKKNDGKGQGKASHSDDKKKVGDKNAEVFGKYIANKKILIADANATSRMGLAQTLVDLGASPHGIVMAPSFQTALDLIEKHKPHVVVADYDLGPRCGLDLLQTQRLMRPESKESLFVLVTGNTSQSAVAQAAEEDVDAYILKPYTIDVLRNSFMRAATEKVTPSEYVRTIEAGKQQMFSGRIDGAMELFRKAMDLNPKPSLACFYHGQAQLMKQALDGAQSSYSQGLEYNKIHYKCLVGLFDLLMNRKQYQEAYDVVKKISRYFPNNPQRLNSVLRLAVVTKSYEDIERYYQVFVSLEERNDQLIKHICAALVVCGKYYLMQDLGSRAMELFQKALIAASGRTKILREVILSLAQVGKAKDAEDFLKRFPSETRTGNDFLAMEYVVLDQTVPASLSIEHGRKLLAKAVYDPVIYQVLIYRTRVAGLMEHAEGLTQEAATRFPEAKDDFRKALQVWVGPMGSDLKSAA